MSDAEDDPLVDGKEPVLAVAVSDVVPLAVFDGDAVELLVAEGGAVPVEVGDTDTDALLVSEGGAVPVEVGDAVLDPVPVAEGVPVAVDVPDAVDMADGVPDAVDVADRVGAIRDRITRSDTSAFNTAEPVFPANPKNALAAACTDVGAAADSLSARFASVESGLQYTLSIGPPAVPVGSSVMRTRRRASVRLVPTSVEPMAAEPSRQ